MVSITKDSIIAYFYAFLSWSILKEIAQDCTHTYVCMLGEPITYIAYMYIHVCVSL